MRWPRMAWIVIGAMAGPLAWAETLAAPGGPHAESKTVRRPTTLADADLPDEQLFSDRDHQPLRSPDKRWRVTAKMGPTGLALRVKNVRTGKADQAWVADGQVAVFWFRRGRNWLLAVNDYRPSDCWADCAVYDPATGQIAEVAQPTLEDFEKIGQPHDAYAIQLVRIMAASPDGRRLLLDMGGRLVDNGPVREVQKYYIVRGDDGAIVRRIDARDQIPGDWWALPAEPPKSAAAPPVSQPDVLADDVYPFGHWGGLPGGPFVSPDGQWQALTRWARPGGANVGDPCELFVRKGRRGDLSKVLDCGCGIQYWWVARAQGKSPLLCIKEHHCSNEDRCSVYDPRTDIRYEVDAKAAEDFESIDKAHAAFPGDHISYFILAVAPDGGRLLLELHGHGNGAEDNKWYVVNSPDGKVVKRYDLRTSVPRRWWED